MTAVYSTATVRYNKGSTLKSTESIESQFSPTRLTYQCFTRQATNMSLGIKTGRELAQISKICLSSSIGSTGTGVNSSTAIVAMTETAANSWSKPRCGGKQKVPKHRITDLIDKTQQAQTVAPPPE
jgi:hypothetical protein